MIPFISGPGNEFVTGVFVYGLIARRQRKLQIVRLNYQQIRTEARYGDTG